MQVMNCCAHKNIVPVMDWPVNYLYTNDNPEGMYNRRKLYICQDCFSVLAIPDDEFNDKYIKPREDLIDNQNSKNFFDFL